MRILVACEYSGRVRDMMRAKGHDAISCDLLYSERPGPHYVCDVREVLDDDWDMLIAFPPCTHLTKAVNRTWALHKREIDEAVEFFLELQNCAIPKKCIENPPGYLNKHVLKPTQTIQPWWFGDPYTKATSLWLTKLPKLVPTKRNFAISGSWCDFSRTQRYRSRTFWGIARAMASQWG